MSEDSTVLVTGNTYPVREEIKKLGAKWDATAKGWHVPEDRLAEATKLVAKADSSATAKPFRYYRCVKCGAKPNNRGWPRIYRNGICSDCYSEDREDY